MTAREDPDTSEPAYGDADRDACGRIRGELCAERRRRLRRFASVLLLSVVSLAALGALVGVRSDLLEQPRGQVASQLASWLLCLVVLPGIGLGLFFPSRATRVALAVGTAVVTLAATLRWPLEPIGEVVGAGSCASILTGYAAVVLLVGVASGAFTQRLRPASALWIAAGVSLTALNAITWQCPVTATWHVCVSHVCVAAGLAVVVSGIGVSAHRRRHRPKA